MHNNRAPSIGTGLFGDSLRMTPIGVRKEEHGCALPLFIGWGDTRFYRRRSHCYSQIKAWRHSRTITNEHYPQSKIQRKESRSQVPQFAKNDSRGGAPKILQVHSFAHQYQTMKGIRISEKCRPIPADHSSIGCDLGRPSCHHYRILSEREPLSPPNRCVPLFINSIFNRTFRLLNCYHGLTSSSSSITRAGLLSISVTCLNLFYIEI